MNLIASSAIPQGIRAKSTRNRHIELGHADIVHGVLTCLFVGGHALLEGVPGLGKTLLVRTLSQVLDLHFNRIQFTPDLMPSDIMGTNIINETTKPGNRAFSFLSPAPCSPRSSLPTRSTGQRPKRSRALLEAMQEHSVTVDETHPQAQGAVLRNGDAEPDREQEGTYPLPEAQLDRFFFKLTSSTTPREELSASLSTARPRGDWPTPAKIMDGEQDHQMASAWCLQDRSSLRRCRTTRSA